MDGGSPWDCGTPCCGAGWLTSGIGFLPLKYTCQRCGAEVPDPTKCRRCDSLARMLNGYCSSGCERADLTDKVLREERERVRLLVLRADQEIKGIIQRLADDVFSTNDRLLAGQEQEKCDGGRQ